jgi:hypothetical protein
MMYYYPNYFGGRCPSCGRCQHCGNSYPNFQPYMQPYYGGMGIATTVGLLATIPDPIEPINAGSEKS